jgi:TonB-linked SusC/RagA family outer membrane protein
MQLNLCGKTRPIGRYFSYQTLLMMKLTLILLTVTCISVSAKVFSQRITLIEKNASLTSLLKSIESQSGYQSFYDAKLLRSAGKVTVDLKGVTLEQALQQVLAGKSLVFSIVDDVIVIKREKQPLVPFVSMFVKISGTVLDEKKLPLPGVSVKIKGSNNGTITDTNGKFQLNVSKGDVLVFSYIGYAAKELEYTDQKTIDISLIPVSNEMTELVVIGYGTVKRKNVTGAISSVKTAELNTATATNIGQALAGRAAGITALQVSGQPGAGVSVKIRSNPSPIASAGALYVVDGVVVNDNAGEPKSQTRYGGSGIDRSPLNFINPNDIESIDFLKDASATAIYGARAGGGVVLITTKRGKGEKPGVEYNGSQSYQKYIKFYDVLGTKDYMTVRNDILKEKWMQNNKIAPFGSVDPATVNAFVPKYTQQQIDAQQEMPSAIDAITRNGLTQQHNLSISGAPNGGKTRYFTSGNFLNQLGVLKHSDFKRYNGRLNLDQALSDQVKVGVNIIVSGSKANNANIGDGANEASGMVLSAFYYPANMPLQNADGTYPINPDYQNSPNPASFLEVTDFTKSNRVLTNGYAEWNILNGLSVRTNFSYDQSGAKRYTYLPKSFLYGARAGGQASIAESTSTSKLMETLLNYTRNFGERSKLTAVAGHSYQLTDFEDLSASNDHFATDNFLFNNLGFGTAQRPQVSSSRSPTKIWKSFFARAIYELDDRYILTASIRRDGASNFAKNKKYGTFPGVSAAWIVSEESFLKKTVPALNMLKLRVGYGTTGNSELKGSAFTYYGPDASYVFGDSKYPGVVLSQLSNDDLTWETQTDINAGIDFGVFNNRISGSFDYFNRTVSNLISEIPLATDFPVEKLFFNSGKTRSRGWDLSIQTKNLVSEPGNGLTWNTAFNLSHYYDSWVERNPEVLKTLAKYMEIQGPYSGLYNYVSDGIYRGDGPAPAWMPGILPGGVIIKDLNGYDANGNLTGMPDGKITSADKTLVGNNGPRYSFGFNNTFTYRNFDLSVYMYGFIHKKINKDYAEAFRTYAQLGAFGWNVLAIAKERWTPTNTAAAFPGGLPDPYATAVGESDYWLENANFIRCRDITLGYRFSNKLLDKQNVLKNLRLSLNVQNPFVITKYRGMDPELQNYLAYPMTRSFTMGLTAVF